MSLGQVHRSRPDVPAPFPSPPDDFELGRYFTDGRRLFRVVSRFNAPPETLLVVLEDCSTLEMIALVPRELSEMGAVPVPTSDPTP